MEDSIPDCRRHATRSSEAAVSLDSLMILRAALLGGTAVALGAFGAHGLRPTLEAVGRTDSWETAVLYQFVHALALVAVGIWVRVDPQAATSRPLQAAGWLWLAGVLCFSGSLYALALGAPSGWIWPVTPFGGLCFLGGWTLLALGARRRGPRAGPTA